MLKITSRVLHLAGWQDGAEITLDLDLSKDRELIECGLVALIDPVPTHALTRFADVERIGVAVDFDWCTIAAPPKGCSVREAVDHYIRATPAPGQSLHSLLRLARWRGYDPRWESLGRAGGWGRHSEPVDRWYQRCRQATWSGFALHRFVQDLDVGKLLLSGLLVAARNSRASPIPRQWWRGQDTSIDLNAGIAGRYEQDKVAPEWVELVVSRGRSPAAGSAPSARRNWTEDQIRVEVRKLYRDCKDDPPNLLEAERLIGQQLPGASRLERVRPVLHEPEFANLRRRSGEKRKRKV